MGAASAVMNRTSPDMAKRGLGGLYKLLVLGRSVRPACSRSHGRVDWRVGENLEAGGETLCARTVCPNSKAQHHRGVGMTSPSIAGVAVSKGSGPSFSPVKACCFRL